MKNIIKLVAVMLVLLSVFVVLASAQTTELPFTDVPEGDYWYKEALTAMYNEKIINGMTATEFNPDGSITRAQFVKLLASIAQINTSSYASKVSSYSDANPAAWYAGPMGWATNAGIIKGNDDGTLKPDNSITRQEIAAVIVRYLEYMGYTLPEDSAKPQFNDYNTFKNTWSESYIEATRLTGIFNGDDLNNFNPFATANRAQAAQIAFNLTTKLDSYLNTQMITIAEKNKASDYKIFFVNSDSTTHVGKQVSDRIKTELGATFEMDPYLGTTVKKAKKLILMGCEADANMSFLYQDLGDNEFAIRVAQDGAKTKLLVAYKNRFTMSYAIEYLMTKYQKDGKLSVPANLDYRQEIEYSDFFKIDPGITRNTRDPYIVYKDGVYYAYTTGWRMYKTTDLTSGVWEGHIDMVTETDIPSDYKSDKWAPEVHEYQGKYYMFTTYSTKTTDEKKNDDTRREFHGCAIFKADTPEGPFKMITNGWITPQDWDSIDGTLYIDKNGDPWMFFVHEHTSIANEIGTMAVAKLSADLTSFVAEPVELFAAQDNPWHKNGGKITDGCFMYTAENGDLLMIWSNYDYVTYKYTIAIARCAAGKDFTNPSSWTHDSSLLYSKIMTDTYGGGHGMIFTDVDGQMYISCHVDDVPTGADGDTKSRLMIFPIVERNNTLVWDLNLD